MELGRRFLGAIENTEVSKTQPPASFDKMSVPEQIDYVNALWERISSRPSEVPVPEWHRREISERLKQHRANPGDVQSWDEVRNNVREDLVDPSARRR